MHIRLSATTSRNVLLACTAGAALCLAGSVVVQAFRAPFQQFSWWGLVASQISLAGERSVAVWFASFLLLLAAAAFVLSYLAERTAAGPEGARAHWPWLVIAAGFAGLSLDEVGSVHEHVGDFERLNFLGGAARTWAGVVAVPVAACAAALAVFAWRRLRRHPLVLVLILGGIALLASVLLQEEIELRMWVERAAAADASGTTIAPRAWYTVLFEEGSELAGSLMFLSAGLVYAHRASRPGSPRRLGEIEARLTQGELRAAALAVPAVLTAGLVSAAVFRYSVPAHEFLGTPAPWFAATMALLAAAATLLLPRGPGWLDTRLVLAAACFAWALDQGAVYLLTDNIWRGSPRMQLATSVAIGAATVATAAWLALSSLPGRVRRRVILWGMLAGIAPLAGHPLAITALLFIAHAVLFDALLNAHLDAAAPAAESAPGERLDDPLAGAPVPPLGT